MAPLYFIVLGIVRSMSWCNADYDSCTEDYTTLEKALLANDTNVFRLKKKLFPLLANTLQYITVTYKFSGCTKEIDKKYLWSRSALYFAVHPHILKFLSLLFAFIEENRVVKSDLELPQACSGLVEKDKHQYLLVLTQRLRNYAHNSNNIEDLAAAVVAVEDRNKEPTHNNRVKVFFSMCIVLPVMTILLLWVGANGAIPYIRTHINNYENYSSVAGLYWFSQTINLFIVTMDVVAIVKNRYHIHPSQQLQFYQLMILCYVAIFECLFIILSFLLMFLPSLSQIKYSWVKDYEFFCFKFFARVLPLGIIGRKEARVWSVLASLITPIVAIVSHAGFIIGGWVSYEDRSTAIILLYLFIFVFIYWSVQYLYCTVHFWVNIHKMGKLKGFCCHKRTVDYNEITDDKIHHEDTVHDVSVLSSKVGFDTLALIGVFPFLSFLVYGIILYLGFGLVVPLLRSLDDALVHIFRLGNFVFVVVIFLLTYKVFTINGGSGAGGVAATISNRAFKYWKFLGKPTKSDLDRAVECLNYTLDVIDSKDDEYRQELSRQRFSLGVIVQHYDNSNRIYHHDDVERFFNELRKFSTDPSRNNEEFKKWLNRVRLSLKCASDEVKKWENAKAEKAFCVLIKYFRNILVAVLGIPPMYFNRDKANALAAALIHQKVKKLMQNIPKTGLTAALWTPPQQGNTAVSTLVHPTPRNSAQSIPTHPSSAPSTLTSVTSNPAPVFSPQHPTHPTMAPINAIEPNIIRVGSKDQDLERNRTLLLLSLIEEDF